MPHYGMLREYRFDEGGAGDIRGTRIYGPDDERLGTVDDVIFDHATGRVHYVVVDTGGWLFNRKFVVPPDRLRAPRAWSAAPRGARPSPSRRA